MANALSQKEVMDTISSFKLAYNSSYSNQTAKSILENNGLSPASAISRSVVTVEAKLIGMASIMRSASDKTTANQEVFKNISDANEILNAKSAKEDLGLTADEQLQLGQLKIENSDLINNIEKINEKHGKTKQSCFDITKHYGEHRRNKSQALLNKIKTLGYQPTDDALEKIMKQLDNQERGSTFSNNETPHLENKITEDKATFFSSLIRQNKKDDSPLKLSDITTLNEPLTMEMIAISGATKLAEERTEQELQELDMPDKKELKTLEDGTNYVSTKIKQFTSSLKPSMRRNVNKIEDQKQEKMQLAQQQEIKKKQDQQQGLEVDREQELGIEQKQKESTTDRQPGSH